MQKWRKSQKVLPAEAINVEDSRDSGQEHGDTGDSSSQQGGGISRQTEAVENKWCVVEDGVDTIPLLEHHGEYGNDGPFEE